MRRYNINLCTDKNEEGQKRDKISQLNCNNFSTVAQISIKIGRIRHQTMEYRFTKNWHLTPARCHVTGAAQNGPGAKIKYLINPQYYVIHHNFIKYDCKIF